MGGSLLTPLALVNGLRQVDTIGTQHSIGTYFILTKLGCMSILYDPLTLINALRPIDALGTRLNIGMFYTNKTWLYVHNA